MKAGDVVAMKSTSRPGVIYDTILGLVLSETPDVCGPMGNGRRVKVLWQDDDYVYWERTSMLEVIYEGR